MDAAFLETVTVVFIKKNSARILCVESILFAIGIYLAGKQIIAGKDKASIIGVFICLSMFIMVLFLSCFYIKLLKREETVREEERQFIERQKKYCDKILVSEKERVMDIRRFRHDIKNHLFVVKKLLEDNDVLGGLKYLQDVLEENNQPGLKIETGNYIIDIVIEDVIKEEDGIVLHWNGVFPQKIKMKDTDLCVLFSNILRNAKEEIMDSMEKEIEVNIRGWKKSLCIECQNVINGNRIRGDREGSGLGLLNVKSVVKKYRGNIVSKSGEKYMTRILFYDIIDI